MKFILGTKAGMTQKFAPDGRVVPCTVVQAGPCVVIRVKEQAGKDGYEAVQVGFGRRARAAKPQAGQWRNVPGAPSTSLGAGSGKPAAFRWVREFRTKAGQLAQGSTIDVSNFKAGDNVRVTGTSKGRGFAGVVKRHGFHGQKSSHGHKDQERMPGSIGSTGPQRVFKGLRMAGRMGGDRVTITNLEVVEADVEKNELYVRGAVPGARGGLLLIVAGEGDMVEVQAPAASDAAEPAAPTVAEESEEAATAEAEAPVEAAAEPEAEPTNE